MSLRSSVTTSLRADDELPLRLLYEDEAPECVGTCLHKVRSELEHQTPDEICNGFRTFCESKAISEFCALHGVNDTSFEWNPNVRVSGGCQRRRWQYLKRQSKLYQNFWKAYKENPDLNLALGFHGTGDANVPKILHSGLDPQYRRTQAFGQGEYFSKEPGLAATYRHEGHCLIVFALLMPKDHEKVYSQKDRDIIVIPELSHQLPLGVVRFDSVDEAIIQHSQEMRLVQRTLKKAAVDADWRVTEAHWKATLEPLLREGLYSEAAEELRQVTRYHKLSRSTMQEMATMVARYIPDRETRTTLFPKLTFEEKSLSRPPSSDKSLKQLEEEAQEAWRAFWGMKMDPLRNRLKKGEGNTLESSTNSTCRQQVMNLSRVGANVVLEQ